MASQSRLPPKKDVALALLEQSTVFVHLDPRSDDVRVPAGFKKQAQLVLQIGYNMVPPIPDLELGDDGIQCTLSFSKVAHRCWIPWDAVFALYDYSQRGMVWPDDVPLEITQATRTESKPTLRAVPNKVGEAAVESLPTAAASEPTKDEKPKKKRARKPPAKDETRDGRKPARPMASRATPAEAKAPARGSATATGGTQAAGADKRRRALPPYLRVIK